MVKKIQHHSITYMHQAQHLNPKNLLLNLVRKNWNRVPLLG